MELKTIAHLGRFKDIALVLLKYGFDELVAEFDVPGKGLIRKIHEVDPEVGLYERIRMALEELGPTFVKIGQIVSLRPDLVPTPLTVELRKLQDEGKPVEFQAIRERIQRECPYPMERAFAYIEEKPLAAASLSQVHRAVLREGDLVVAAKVQRPGIRPLIRIDLDILAGIAQRLQDRFENLEVYDLPEVVRIIRRTLLRELDFRVEARNMRVARSYFQDEPRIYVPRAYEPFCTENLLVMEYIEGTRLKNFNPTDLLQGQELAKLGLKSMIEQILRHGFFHADPHPGNVLIEKENTFCLIDWGMIGRLTMGARHELIDLIDSVVEKDSQKLLHSLLTISGADAEVDRRGLERELLEILDTYHSIPIKDLQLGHLLLDIITLLQVYRLHIPPDLAVMIKAVVTAEGTARLLNPDLNIVMEAGPHVKRLAMERYEPKSIWRSMRYTLSQLGGLQRKVPERLGQIVDKMVQGEFSIRFEHENLGGIRQTLEDTFNRLVLGVITAAMIIGSSMIITTGVGPFLFGLPALGVVGFVLSGVFGLWLVISIIRTRRF